MVTNRSPLARVKKVRVQTVFALHDHARTSSKDQTPESRCVLVGFRFNYFLLYVLRVWESKGSCCAECKEALNRGGWLSGDHLMWVKLLGWSHGEARATANKATYGGDSFKYSEPLEKHCSHRLKCEMMCGEIARGNITIISGSSLEDIDLEDSC